jgi:phenylacetaldehyde dehydrogenase
MTISTTVDRVPASLREWLSKPRPMLIDGKWVQAKSGKTFEVLDPATEMLLANVAEGDAADVDAATRSAI